MMTMPKAMKEATHSLLQRGVKMQTYDVKHPPPVRNMTNAYDTHTRAFQIDSKGGSVSNSHVRHGEGVASIDNQKVSYKCKNKGIYGVYINHILV